MSKSCNNCFHCEACHLADAEGHIPGEDYDVGETCPQYVNEESIFIKSEGNPFKQLTDETWQLWNSFMESGFNGDAAFTLTTKSFAMLIERRAASDEQERIRRSLKNYRGRR